MRDDAFIIRLTSDGNALEYGTFLGVESNEDAYAVAIDGSDSVYVAGITGSSTFPITPGAFDSTFSGSAVETFITKLDPAGSSLAYSTLLGGNSSERPFAIAVDGTGSAAVTGQTASDNFPVTAGAFQEVIQGGTDVFVTVLGPTGTTASFSNIPWRCWRRATWRNRS